MNFSFFFFCLVLMATQYRPTSCASVSAMMLSESPEPVTLDGLFLTTAGVGSRVLYELRDGMTICTDDFATGVNVLCAGDSRAARFYLNGVKRRTEYKAPFYIGGDVRGRVRAWANPPTSALIECRMKNPKRAFKASVTFQC